MAAECLTAFSTATVYEIRGCRCVCRLLPVSRRCKASPENNAIMKQTPLNPCITHAQMEALQQSVSCFALSLRHTHGTLI